MDSGFVRQQIEAPGVDDAADAHDEARYAAVVARRDGAFFYGVTSTGVFCRPSCKARTPLRKNVRFFAAAVDAEAAGFRACKRCQPTGPSPQAQQAALVAQATALIDGGLDDGGVDFIAVAAACGVSRHHFHRVFVGVTGLTPGAWTRERKAARLRAALPSASSVTAAGYEAGFSSSSRLAAAELGMTPGALRQQGQGERIVCSCAPCSLGVVLVARTDRGVCCVLLGDDASALRADLKARFARATIVEDVEGGEGAVAAVVAVVDDPQRGFSLPLDLRGTAFQLRVWQALRDIPAGQTRSYADVARAVGDARAVRAVASACAQNKVAVVIPCHRVVKSDGGLSGYRWGVERKRSLLSRERQAEEDDET